MHETAQYDSLLLICAYKVYTASSANYVLLRAQSSLYSRLLGPHGAYIPRASSPISQMHAFQQLVPNAFRRMTD